MENKAVVSGGTPPQPHFTKGAKRTEAYKWMLASMMSTVLWNQDNETKAHKKRAAQDFLKRAIETAMQQIDDFGDLTSWLNQLKNNDGGYTPSMQAWIHNLASQMGNFKDEKDEKAITDAQTTIKTKKTALESDEKMLGRWEDAANSILKKIKDKNSLINSLKGKLDNPFLGDDEIGDLNDEIGSLKDDVGELETKYAAAKGMALLYKENVSDDKDAIKSATAQLNNALRAPQSQRVYLMKRIENNGESQGDEAKEGIQEYKSDQSKKQATFQTLLSIMDNISDNAKRPAPKSKT